MRIALLIAMEFCRILRRDLSVEDLGEVCARNAVETSSGVCHSHDFCDANMVMEEAFHALGRATCADIGLDANPGLAAAHQASCDLWDEAWGLVMPMIGGRLWK